MPSREVPKRRAFNGKCIALISELVGSSAKNRKPRIPAQEELVHFIEELNRRYEAALLSKFAVARDNELQGLLLDSSVLPELVWDIETRDADRLLRIGVGLGTLRTAVQEFAVNVDGECMRMARIGLNIAMKRDLFGGVFAGFGENGAPILNGYARLLWRHRSSLSSQQRKVALLLKQGLTQSAAADQMGLTRQAVSLYAKAAAWEAYVEGENGWKTALSKLGRLD